MSYSLDNIQTNLKDFLIKKNNITNDLLDVDNFNVDFNIDALVYFKNCLIEDKNKKFFIVGDYDCDGICSTTIIKLLFNHLNIQSNYLIPSRLKQGYGINDDIVDIAYKHGFECLLLLDNGIIAYDCIKKAKQLGLSIYIIDHHEYDLLPDAKAILHPNLLNKPYIDLCTSGLTCLLASCFNDDILYQIYGGLGTLADMVKVLGYNRYLLKQMLRLLKENNVKTIKLLLANNEISYESISFNVIPKINAISRLEKDINANHVVKYLLGENTYEYSSLIEQVNLERKDLSNKYYQEAKNNIDINNSILIYSSKSIPEGICGIIANRLIYEYNKAVIVLNEKEDEFVGSGRSPGDFNLYEYLKNKEELFTSYGGHNNAVGLKISKENFTKLCEYINTSKIDYIVKDIDVIEVKLDDINLDLYKQIDDLQPYGSGFKEPLFYMKNVEYNSRIIIKNIYPRFILNNFVEAISFNPNYVDKTFNDMVFNIHKNKFKNNGLSLIITDLI